MGASEIASLTNPFVVWLDDTFPYPVARVEVRGDQVVDLEVRLPPNGESLLAMGCPVYLMIVEDGRWVSQRWVSASFLAAIENEYRNGRGDEGE